MAETTPTPAETPVPKDMARIIITDHDRRVKRVVDIPQPAVFRIRFEGAFYEQVADEDGKRVYAPMLP